MTTNPQIDPTTLYEVMESRQRRYSLNAVVMLFNFATTIYFVRFFPDLVAHAVNPMLASFVRTATYVAMLASAAFALYMAGRSFWTGFVELSAKLDIAHKTTGSQVAYALSQLEADLADTRTRLLAQSAAVVLFALIGAAVPFVFTTDGAVRTAFSTWVAYSVIIMIAGVLGCLLSIRQQRGEIRQLAP